MPRPSRRRRQVVGDQRGIHVRLDRARLVDDDGRDAGLAAIDEVAQEAAHVQAGAGQASTLSPSRTWALIQTRVVLSFRSGLTLML